MSRPPPRLTRTDTPFPNTTRVRTPDEPAGSRLGGRVSWSPMGGTGPHFARVVKGSGIRMRAGKEPSGAPGGSPVLSRALSQALKFSGAEVLRQIGRASCRERVCQYV